MDTSSSLLLCASLSDVEMLKPYMLSAYWSVSSNCASSVGSHNSDKIYELLMFMGYLFLWGKIFADFKIYAYFLLVHICREIFGDKIGLSTKFSLKSNSPVL